MITFKEIKQAKNERFREIKLALDDWHDMELTNGCWISAAGSLMVVMMVMVDMFSWFRGFSPVMIVVTGMVRWLRSSDAGMVMMVGMIREHQIVVIKVMLVTVMMMVIRVAALPFGFWRGFLGEFPVLRRFPHPESFTCRRPTLGRPFLDVLDLAPHLMVQAE